MIRNNLLEHMASEAIHLLTPAKITKGKMYRLYNDKWISNETFNELHPYIKLETLPKANPDGTRIP